MLAAAVALGVAGLVAGLVSPPAWPLTVIGGAVVDLSPHSVTEFTISTFGRNDKLVLSIGMALVIAAIAAALGVVSITRLRAGLAGFGAFGVLGAAVALTRPAAALVDTLPALLGAVAGAAALLLLIQSLAPGPVAKGAAPAEDRRRFLRIAGLAVAVTAVGGWAGTTLQRRFDVSQARSRVKIPTPAATSPVQSGPTVASGIDFATVDGLSPLFTPNKDFYRIDTALLVPQIDPAGWSLRIHGRVANERKYTFDELLARSDLIEADISLACVSNEVGGPLTGAARWVGVPLANILAEVGPDPAAGQLITRSSDGWTCGTPTQDAMTTPNAMLALSMNGEPLPVEHGFPVRMIVPGLYGYVSATKWIVDMEFTGFADAASYWVQRGWDAMAPILTFSRIDTPGQSRAVRAGRVPIAGVALSGSKAISKVEVKIDDTDWQPATLAPQTSVQLWRQWVLPWDAETGRHVLSVRATDELGQLQSEEQYSPYPNASSGWHTVNVTVT